jgi:hypothetical protein
MGFFDVTNFDLFSCQTSYHIIEEEVYSEECTVYFEDLCEPPLVQLRKKRDLSNQALPGYPYPAHAILPPSKCQQSVTLCLLSTVGLY